MVLKRLKEEQQRIRKEFREKTISYILAAFGLVAGLAWNEAIKAVIESFFPASGNIVIKFIYALLVTVMLVITSIYLLRFIENKEEQK